MDAIIDEIKDLPGVSKYGDSSRGAIVATARPKGEIRQRPAAGQVVLPVRSLPKADVTGVRVVPGIIDNRTAPCQTSEENWVLVPENAMPLAGVPLVNMSSRNTLAPISTPLSTSKAVADFMSLPKKECHRVYLEKAFPPLALDSTPKEIFDFICRDCGRKDTSGKALINPGGRRAYWRSVRAFYNWVYSAMSGLPLSYRDNPVPAISATIMATLKTGNRIMPAVTALQVKVLLNQVKSTAYPIRNAALVCLFYDSGGRLSAITGIKEPNIDFTKHLIRVREKGGNKTWVVFGKLSEKYLRKWLTLYDPEGENIWGMKSQGVRDMFRSLQLKTGIKCNPHAFRRGWASELTRMGVSGAAVQTLGNWSDPKMPALYTRSVKFEELARGYKSPLDSLTVQLKPRTDRSKIHTDRSKHRKDGLAGDRGFEPLLTDPESAVLPLD